MQQRIEPARLSPAAGVVLGQADEGAQGAEEEDGVIGEPQQMGDLDAEEGGLGGEVASAVALGKSGMAWLLSDRTYVRIG